MSSNPLMVIAGKILRVIEEGVRLLPDSIVLGTGIISILSLSKSYAILLASMFELMVIQRIVANIFASVKPIGAGPNALQDICQPGFVFPNLMRISIIEHIGIPSSFPSPVMFFLTGILSYMVSSVRQFENEINALKGDLQTRSTVGVVLSVLLLIGVFFFRVTYGCETFDTLLLSIVLGIFAGVGIMYQNSTMFGRAGVNILNLPMILSPSEAGNSSMYVCGPAN